jgi:hypothetical protein
MSTQTNITNDVSTLLRVPTKVSKELVDKTCLCISSAICEAKRNGETQITIGIGIGTLSVNLLDMQCKFVPGKNLKTAIKTALSSQTDPLETALEQAFADKLLSICEEVL